MSDDTVKPVVSSSPPRVADGGEPVQAVVGLEPFGNQQEKGDMIFYMSIDEADALGRRLLEVCELARDNRYTDV